jgi:flagellar biosynthesis chaperone FliJ
MNKDKKLQKKIGKARTKVEKAGAKLQKLESKQARRMAKRTPGLDGQVEVHSAVN